MSRSSNDNELLAVHISRRDLAELIEVLKKAEELCDSMRSNAQDFRMQRVRLEMLRTSSVPPPPEARESTRFIELKDVAKPIGKKRG